MPEPLRAPFCSHMGQKTTIALVLLPGDQKREIESFFAEFGPMLTLAATTSNDRPSPNGPRNVHFIMKLSCKMKSSIMDELMKCVSPVAGVLNRLLYKIIDNATGAEEDEDGNPIVAQAA